MFPVRLTNASKQKSIKAQLWEVEHYIDASAGSEAGSQQQLEEQIMKTKQETVKLERMLLEELEAERDAFDDNDDDDDDDERRK